MYEEKGEDLSGLSNRELEDSIQELRTALVDIENVRRDAGRRIKAGKNVEGEQVYVERAENQWTQTMARIKKYEAELERRRVKVE